MSKVYVVLSVLVLFIMIQGVSFAQEQVDVTPVFPRFSIEDTEVRNIHSDIVGVDYTINIFLPPDYHRDDVPYPVVYTIGSTHFWMLSRIARLSSGMGISFIVVCIEHKSDDPKGLIRDILPVIRKDTTSSYGGAEKFAHFLQDELYPFIDTSYKTDPTDRTYCGHSGTGIFGMYALLKQTELFNRYVLSSPGVNWGNPFFFECEEAYAQTHTDMPVTLFITMGELEAGDNNGFEEFVEFSKILEGRNYPNLTMKSLAMENATHSTLYPRAMSEGVWYVFSNYLCPPDEVIGRYVFSPDYIINVIKEKNRFFLEFEGLNAYKHPITKRSSDGRKYSIHRLKNFSFVQDGETVRLSYPIRGKVVTLLRTAPGDESPFAGKSKLEPESYVGEYLFSQDTVRVREENDCIFVCFQQRGKPVKVKITSDGEGNTYGIAEIFLFPLSFGKNDKGEVESLTIPYFEGTGRKIN